ncbi:MAG: cell division protein ZapE [Proteobacteria bacterium]|nr:cell division protein ZapE [Pseudomonadota bacterium]
MSIDDPINAYRARVAAGEIHPDPGQEHVVDRLQSLHSALRERQETVPVLQRLSRILGSDRQGSDRPKGLYIYGPPGRGKSMLMDLFFESASVENRRRVHVHPFMQEIHARLHQWRQEGPVSRNQDPLSRLAEEIAEASPLLCFDEFQVEAVADAMIVRRLFEAVLDLGVTIVATSNTALDDLYAGGLQRERFLPFIDLLKQRMDVVQLGGETDYRRDRLKSVGVYHAPLGPESAAALDNVFERLTDGAIGEPEIISVQGRVIAVPRQARGVARFCFADLCEQPLGPADYWSIACQYQTVILSDIPQLSARERNAAKRFATLIETLYEQRTKLVCSAAALPDQLYVEGDGSAIFTRVASRLEEMQSEDYLSEPHRPSTGRVAA